ncbi:MAG TPA: ABC transporter substrate-binding protein [Alphaproteobacteria bacterium]|nr:ABC transporter substrate-binding protein [Alphaproteobacteria bacterium]
MTAITRFAAGVLMAAALAFGVHRAEAAPAKITIAQTSAAIGFTPVSIAQDEGFFKKNGIDADITIVSHGDSSTIAALHSGDVQFGAMTLVPALQAMAHGEKLLFVSPFVREFVIQFVINPAAAKKIGLTPNMPLKERFERAKGLTVGTLDVGGGLDLMFRAMVTQYGLNPQTDYTETSINSYPSLLLSCKRGQIDIALTAIPFGRMGVADEGLKMFADFWGGEVPEFNGLIHQGMVVPADYAKAHPDVVRRMHKALDEALIFMHKHPNETVADLHKRYDKLPVPILRSFIVGDAKSYASRAIFDRKGFDMVRDFTAKHLMAQVAEIKYDAVVIPEARQK